MKDLVMTDFSNICDILGFLYSQYREEEEFVDFIQFNDVGLPLAYFAREHLMNPSDDGVRYILETWSLFLQGLGLDDTGFTDLDSVLDHKTVPINWNLGGPPGIDIDAPAWSPSAESEDISLSDLTYAGSFAVDSGQAMVGDPRYLDDWDTNTKDKWDLNGKIGQYSYQGASATTIANNFGALGNAAVVFSTGHGDGFYPVFVKLDEDGIVGMVVIDFESHITIPESNTDNS